MNVKVFKFRDVQKISKLVTQLDLKKEDINDILNVLTGAQKEMLGTEADVELYLLNNVSAKERKELYKEHENDIAKLREFALNHKGVSSSAGFFEVALKLLGIVADKFDLIADFMGYYLEDYTAKQVLDMEEEEAVDAVLAVFTNPGFVKFFSRLFNLKLL